MKIAGGRGDGMLTGQYSHNLDPKGRISFPARLREEQTLVFYFICFANI